MADRATILLGSPYGQTGGGMGSIMNYLASMREGPALRYEFKKVETRGGGHILRSPWHLVTAAARILAEAASGRLALVHLNLAEGGSVYRKAFLLAVTKMTGRPVLLHLHAARIRQFHESVNVGGKWLLRWMFQTADHSVVLGDVWRTWVIENFDVPGNRVSIVYNGVPAPPGVRPADCADRPFQLLFVGNLSERKGVSDLLNALASPSMRERNMNITLAGGGPVDHYLRLAAELGIGDRTRFEGWVSQDTARSLMLRADALILPSYDEGLPLVILEALASGTPVICTPVGSVPEVLQDRQTALFVTPGAQPDIARAVCDLMDNPGLRDKLAAAGTELFARSFTVEAFARSITSLYASVLGSRMRRTVVRSPVQPARHDNAD